MKKLMFCLLMLVCLTGCDKSLKCTSVVENDAMKIKKVYRVYSEGDVISKVKGNITYEVVDENLNNNFDSMAILLKSEYEEKQIPFEYNTEGNKYIFDVTYDVESLSDDNFKSFIGSKNLSEYKQKLIKEGFNCK